MREIPIIDIKVRQEPTYKYGCTDEAFRAISAEITVNQDLQLRTKQIAVGYEVLATYLGAMLDRDIIETIAEAVVDAIDELE
jgi:hypothetical protein